MATQKDFNIVKAPDGFYIGRIMKNGMISKDLRKISDQEIIAMFEDVLKRNRAETGRSTMSVFSHGKPVLVAKLNPDIRECGVLPQPTAEEIRQMQAMRMRQMQMAAQQARQVRMPKVGDFSLPRQN